MKPKRLFVRALVLIGIVGGLKLVAPLHASDCQEANQAEAGTAEAGRQGTVEAGTVEADTAEAGRQDDVVDQWKLPTGRLLSPAGDSFAYHGRPVDVAISAGRVFAKDRNSLLVIDADSMELIQRVSSPGGASLTGLCVSESGRIYLTNASNGLHVFAMQNATNEYGLEQTIELPGDSFPCGVAIDPTESVALVCLSKKNELLVIDLANDELPQQDSAETDEGAATREPSFVARIPVGVAPFEVLVDWQEQVAWVSNLGGRRLVEGQEKDVLTAPSAGTATIVDERGIASRGSVSRINLVTNESTHEIGVELQPSCLGWGAADPTAKSKLLVCNSNADVITEVDTTEFGTREISVRPDGRLPFGSMPTDVLRLSDPHKESQHVFVVALAGNNALAVLDQDFSLRGLVPTGWYPVALASDGEHLVVANVKGNGGRAEVRAEEKGRNSHDHQGTIQRLEVARIFDAGQLASWTSEVKNNGRVPQILRARELVEQGPSSDEVKPAPVPARLGDPSVFQHIIYVIKENRTFDQVFGDVADARSEPELCIFPESITPNHHALADRFGLLDNYYCNGVLSADGHSWATEGNVTPYLERAFGGFARSYTFGDDPLTYSRSGFIWDRILGAGLSFRNYGEFDYAEPPEGMKYQEIWQAYERGEQLEFSQQIGIKRLRDYSCREYPGWNMVIPDVLRMDRFLKEFREFEKDGGLPNFCIVYLPQDHLGGGVTSNAHMADNDLALGRLVEAVSHSRYWKDTVIFVNEDDPQNGYDHIDGHRSLCLVVSAYSQPGINHSFYNQTSVLRTMLHILGLPPMNQQDASMPLMMDCFRDEPDLQPFDALPAQVALNEAPQPPEQQAAVERRWRRILATVPIERTGMKTERDEDNLNRFVWHETRGWETPYPDSWAGPHGRGLKSLGLMIDESRADEDD